MERRHLTPIGEYFQQKAFFLQQGNEEKLEVLDGIKYLFALRRDFLKIQNRWHDSAI